MCSQKKTNVSTKQYSNEIDCAADAIKNADRILLGIGSGMTAAGGLCYTDNKLAKKWYPEYYAMGQKSIVEIMGNFWITHLDKQNMAAFWGFWAKHIFHIRYEALSLQPYTDLFSIISEKDYFVCSTNVDGQLEKAGFDKSKIFAPQGDYALFQCEKPCSQDVYDNKAMIDNMLKNMVSPLEIRESDIPYCPKCGSHLIPNLRCDYSFVEKPHMENAKPYQAFLDTSKDKRLILFELGVGFNTPGIIRLPFEQITRIYPFASLIRINNAMASVPNNIIDKTISVQLDAGVFLQALHEKCFF